MTQFHEKRPKVSNSAKIADFEAKNDKSEVLYTETIDYIPSREFLQPENWAKSDESIIDALIKKFTASGHQSNAGLPVHLDRMAHWAVLTGEEEAALFRQMNFHKFQASLLNGDPTQPGRATVAVIRKHLGKAQDLRDLIVQVNFRLVMLIAKKFVSAGQSFDEALSDGIVTLMQSVEKFDYSRGFRFSTYAYRSIARSLSRKVARSSNERPRFVTNADDWAFEQEDDRPLSEQHDQVWSNVREITASLLENLDRRERFIIRCRFALGSHRMTRSFQFLSDKLAVSKERVRQLAHRALGKLQSMAKEFDMDELFGASMA